LAIYEREDVMSGAWKRVLTDCFQGDQLAEWKAAKERLGASFDHAGHAAAWADYNARVQAALPLDPDSVAEWDALCADYKTVVDEKVLYGEKPLWAFPMVLDDPEMFIQR
jgi:hypothetical protein